MSEPEQRNWRIGEKLPFLVDLEWYLFRKRRSMNFKRFRDMTEYVLDMVQDAESVTPREANGKKVFIFGMIRLWIQYSASLSLTFDLMGYDVTLAYLPYNDWFTDSSNREDGRLNHIYGECLKPLSTRVKMEPLFSPAVLEVELPEELARGIELISERDFQYSRQVEEVDRSDQLFALRQKRNRYAARQFLDMLQADRPDVALIPNGMILEYGALYQVAQYLGIPAVTYEFGEQKDKIWISQDKPVMFQNTDAMWARFKDQPFSDEQHQQVEELFASRKNATLWQKFSRQWQEIPSEGESEVKTKLGLDQRPIVLMAVNVIGDSLTLGRQVYSKDMTEWISRTLEYFRDKPEVQFVLRIHPGERYTDGPSVEDIVRQRIVDVPDHFRVISASDKVNTYDLVEIADLGLTYTTTVGMEMAMSGLPVIVSGKTHYRDKGFTLDPGSWEEFFSMVEAVLSSPEEYQYSEEKVRTAWQYAYRFYFDYPFASPWHLRGMRPMFDDFPISRLFTDEGWQQYGKTFKFLLNEPDEG